MVTIKRDAAVAQREAAEGMHHTMYWACIINKLLFMQHPATQPRALRQNSDNGAWYSAFTDPDTGATYDIRIKKRQRP